MAAVLFSLLAPVVSAQSVDGKWTTGLHGRGSDGQVITITLKSDGNNVTGTVNANQPIPLEGSIQGNTLRVTMKVTAANGNQLLMNYVALLDGDTLRFTYQSENGRPPVFGPAAREFTATRVN